MSDYEDDAQIEQLRRWWRENWMALAAGLVLGLGGIYGWEAWQTSRDRQAEQASQMFEDLKRSLAGRPDAARTLADSLAREFASTPYASQAALLLAQREADSGNWDAARERLTWVSHHTADEGLRKLARLRLARVHWQLGDTAAALGLLQIAEQDAFAALYFELRGDILLSQGDRAAARSAYQKALDLGPAAATRDLLQHKLDDLAEAA